MDKIFDKAESMPPWCGHSMTGPITPLALSRKIELTDRTLTTRNQSPFLIFKKDNFVRGIDLKINDSWRLDLLYDRPGNSFIIARHYGTSEYVPHVTLPYRFCARYSHLPDRL
jgi:hypothetical protein